MPKKTLQNSLLPAETIASKIYLIRNQKVMLDRDLAELYGVQTRVLKQAVRRNIGRFPSDFMFELTNEEQKSLRSQIVTLKKGQHSKYLSFAFTEQGVAMLSSVLKSDRAIQVNIQIIRTFTKLRSMLATHKDLKRKIEAMEKKYDKNFQIVFEAIKQLFDEEEKPKKKIGYLKEKTKTYGKRTKKKWTRSAHPRTRNARPVTRKLQPASWLYYFDLSPLPAPLNTKSIQLGSFKLISRNAQLDCYCLQPPTSQPARSALPVHVFRIIKSLFLGSSHIALLEFYSSSTNLPSWTW